MNSLTFPDVSVWLAFLREDHQHRSVAKQWWDTSDSEVLAFSRLTHLSVLRLLTTAAVMGGKPLSMSGAWNSCGRLFDDPRATILPDPPTLERSLRRYTARDDSSPKLWADAYLLAFAEEAGGTVVTFDQALARRAPHCLLLA